MIATTHETTAWRYRAAGWYGLAAILVARMMIEFAGMSVRSAVLLADAITYLLPMLLVVITGSVLSLRMLGRGVEHRLWGLLTIAVALVLIGETYWTYYSVAVHHHGPPLDSPVRLVFVAAALVFLSGAITLTHFLDEPLSVRVALYLDSAAVMVVLFPIVFRLWTWHAFADIVPRLQSAATAAVYPVFGALIMGVTSSLLVRWWGYRWRMWERLTAASLVVYGAGLFAFPAWYPSLLRTTALTATWFPWLLGTGFYLLFMSMVYRLTEDEGDAGRERWPLIRGGVGAPRAFPVVMAAALIVLGYEAVSGGSGPETVPVLASTVCLAVLLAARSWVSELERGYHQQSAMTDQATGALSRRYLDARLGAAMAEAGDTGAALTVFDIDGFSRFENQDDAALVLVEVAHVLASVGRGAEEVFRLGADEFAVIACGSNAEQAAAAAESAIAAVRDRVLDRLGHLVVLSAGVAVYPTHATNAAEMLSAAREACRCAKGALGGEVRVVGAPSATSALTGTAPRARSDSKVRAGRDTVIVLAAAVDARDSVTRNHSAGVAELMGPLCRMLGLSEDRVQMASLAALVHDVGKIGIPDAVLRKEGPLDPEERLLIEEHPELGERILSAARLGEIGPIARHHHERWDGRGYPDRLEGHQIPFEARALAVCDTFETLLAGRPYQAARSLEDAIAEIEANAGSQFDPMIAAVFVRMLRRELDFARDGLGLGTVLQQLRTSA